MKPDTQPISEPLNPSPKSIREYFDLFNSRIGAGENPLFANQQKDIVFRNFVGDEKPIFYVTDSNGVVKEWLTQPELASKSKEVQVPDEEVLFDMFSFMVGGRKPRLTELGVTSWREILANNQVNFDADQLEKVGKIFDFLDANPKTTLTGSIADFVGLSHSSTQKFQIARAVEGNSTVILQGDSCFNRGKLYVWHPIRNQRSPIQRGSPLREDGGVCIDHINDVQVGYQTTEGVNISRINTFVYLLARHGLSEEVTEATAADQKYMTLEEYKDQIFKNDPVERQRSQQLENDNFVICGKLGGHSELQNKRKNEIIQKLVDQAAQGNLDEILRNIEQF